MKIKEHSKTVFWIFVMVGCLAIMAAITVVYWSIWDQYKDVPMAELPAWVYWLFFGGD